MSRNNRASSIGARVGRSGLLGLLIGLCLAVASTALAAGPTLKIGYVGGITGACAGLTSYAVKAMKLATEEINKSGGILGRQIEVIYRDSKTRPDEGAKQARDLILSEKVEILTGVCSASVFMAVNPIAEQYKVPLFSAISGTHRTNIDFGHPYVYQTQPHTMIEGKALAEFAAKQPWNTIVTMGLDYEWGRVTVKVFKEELAKLKPSVKFGKELWPRIGETNMASYITAALADKPDAVMAVMFGDGTISMVKQGEAYGFLQRTKLLTFLSTEAMISLGNEIPDGIYGWARAPFYALGTANGAEFVKKYRAAYNEYPADWGVLGYDVMYIIKAGIEKAGGTDPEKLPDAMASLTFNTLRGPLKMRKLDNTMDSPVYMGVSKKTPEYPFPIMVNVDRIPGEHTLPSVAVVEQLRKEAKKQ